MSGAVAPPTSGVMIAAPRPISLILRGLARIWTCPTWDKAASLIFRCEQLEYKSNNPSR